MMLAAILLLLIVGAIALDRLHAWFRLRALLQRAAQRRTSKDAANE